MSIWIPAFAGMTDSAVLYLDQRLGVKRILKYHIRILFPAPLHQITYLTQHLF